MTKGLDGFLSEKIPEPEVLPVQEGASVIFKAAKEGSLKLIKKLTDKGLWYKVITPNQLVNINYFEANTGIYTPLVVGEYIGVRS